MKLANKELFLIRSIRGFDKDQGAVLGITVPFARKDDYGIPLG